MAKLKPPKNYRTTKGRKNCANCLYFPKETNATLAGPLDAYECDRGAFFIGHEGTNKVVCDGHKQEAKDE